MDSDDILNGCLHRVRHKIKPAIDSKAKVVELLCLHGTMNRTLNLLFSLRIIKFQYLVHHNVYGSAVIPWREQFRRKILSKLLFDYTKLLLSSQCRYCCFGSCLHCWRVSPELHESQSRLLFWLHCRYNETCREVHVNIIPVFQANRKSPDYEEIGYRNVCYIDM